MGEDQAHEQHNKVIKESGGAVGIFDNDQAILEWAISGPAISKLIEPKESANQVKSHHEDTDAYEKKFLSDTEMLHQSFMLWGNPFEESESSLVHHTSKRVLPDEAEKSVRCALAIGKEQSESFQHERDSLYQTLHQNKLALYRKKNGVIESKKKTGGGLHQRL